MNLKKLNAEQVGFIDKASQSLRMAGGEFCLNATAALAANCARQNLNNSQNIFKLQVSGWPEIIKAQTVQITPQEFQVTLELNSLTYELIPLASDLNLLVLPGICHVLKEGRLHPFELKRLLPQIIKRYQLEDQPCVGLINYQSLGSDEYEITPLVFVKEVETIVFEQACGSGSLALALSLDPKTELNLNILQPSKATICFRGSSKQLFCQSKVTCLAEGQVTLEF